MRAVRCDACGAKAMVAAAQCPKCGHLFELRNGFGELAPLAYCSGCESYYPESHGQCKWCGTKPERAPIGAGVWRGAGVTALVALVITALILRPGESKDLARRRTAATAKPDSSPPAARDTTAPLTVASTAPPIATSTPAPTAPIVVPQAAPASPRVVSSEPAAPTPTPSAPRRPTPWVRVVSRHWVIVRKGASTESGIVASIGPNSRVELGEVSGSWRRIRARGLTGWVEPRSSFYEVGSR